MFRSESKALRMVAVLFGTTITSTSFGIPDLLELVGKLPIEHCASSQILFSPAGDKVIIDWPKGSGSNAWLIDVTSEKLAASELSGPRANWGPDGPRVLSKANGFSENAFQSFFNADETRLGAVEGGVSLVDESGSLLHPNWHSRSVQGSLPIGQRPAEVVAVVGERRYPIVLPGKRYPVKATFDPILMRILLHGRDGRELIDISGKELTRTHLPDSLRFTLVPGRNFLIAAALLGGDIHGREPDSITVHISDIRGNLIEQIPVAVEHSEFSVADVMVRCSPKLVLVTTRETLYVFKIQSDL